MLDGSEEQINVIKMEMTRQARINWKAEEEIKHINDEMARQAKMCERELLESKLMEQEQVGEYLLVV